jgi:putative tryptophan/tyrosine transport system substrate-binding protein
MTAFIGRREFITLIGGATAWPLSVRAQHPALPVIGFLNGQWPDTFAHAAAAFREGLQETGFIDGQNVKIEYRWAEGQDDRLPAMASELVRRQVAVIAATGASAAADAAKAATSTIPILFIVGADPVKLGLVASLNRPGGNLTGVNQFTNTLSAKRLELLREMLPGATSIGFLLNPDGPQAEFESLDLETAARAIGMRIEILTARNAHDIDALSTTLAQHQISALFVAANPLLASQATNLIAMAARHGVPVMWNERRHTAAGGLVSYGTSIEDAYRQVGIYAGRILKGAKPTDLPVVQPTKFSLVINLKTAKALGIDVPDKLLALADEVIE